MNSFRPSQLQFSQDSIKPYFDNGKGVNETIDEIAGMWWFSRGSVIDNLQPLEVAQCRNDGMWYSNNNRRLYVFRVLEKRGLVSTVQTVQGHLRPKPPSAGCHVTLRGGVQPYPQCKCGDKCSVM